MTFTPLECSQSRLWNERWKTNRRTRSIAGAYGSRETNGGCLMTMKRGHSPQVLHRDGDGQLRGASGAHRGQTETEAGVIESEDDDRRLLEDLPFPSHLRNVQPTPDRFRQNGVDPKRRSKPTERQIRSAVLTLFEQGRDPLTGDPEELGDLLHRHSIGTEGPRLRLAEPRPETL